jgi:hypothetical protein
MRTDKGQICKNLADNDECRDCIFVLFSDGTLLHYLKYADNCSEFTLPSPHAIVQERPAGATGTASRTPLAGYALSSLTWIRI